MADNELLTVAARAAAGGLTLRDAVRECERLIITEALKARSNDKQAVAKLLQISMASLYRKVGEELPMFEGRNTDWDTEFE